MSWNDEPISLSTKHWRVLQLDGKGYLLKGHFEEDSYHVMLSDLCTIWEETLASEDIIQRSKTLNLSIEAPLSVLLKKIQENISSDAHGSFTLPPTHAPSQPHTLTLSLTTTLTSLPFKWRFNLEQAPSHTMESQLVGPLLGMVGELSHRIEQLVQLLASKDREIHDYREQGAEVSRKYLETVPFVEALFTAEMRTSSGFPARAHCTANVLSQQSVQELYRDVSQARLWAENNDGASEEVEDTVSTNAVAVISPLTSPVKKPPPVTSPSKEDEAARRKELERKLEQEKQKPKKKKRKLM